MSNETNINLQPGFYNNPPPVLTKVIFKECVIEKNEKEKNYMIKSKI